MIRSPLNVPTPAMPMPDFDVPYAAPMPVYSLPQRVFFLQSCFFSGGMRTSEYHGEGDACHAQEGREFGREIVFGHGGGGEVMSRMM